MESDLLIEETQSDDGPPQWRELLYITCIFVCITFGTACITLPYTILQASVYGWFPIMIIATAVLLYTCHLIIECMLRKALVTDHERAPFAYLAEQAGGKLGRKAFNIIFFATTVGLAIALIVVAAETLTASIIKFEGINHYNQVRIALVICWLIVTPFMYIGYLKDNIITSVIGFLLAFCTFLIIISNSFIFGHKATKSHITLPKVTVSSFVTAFGTILTSLATLQMLIPSVVTETADKKNPMRACYLCYAICFAIYVFAAFVPYYVFGADLVDSALTTLAIQTHNSRAVYVSIIVAQLMISAHLILAVVLLLNPMSQQLEEFFKVPISKFDNSSFTFDVNVDNYVIQ